MSRLFSTDDVRRAIAAGAIEKTAADGLLAFLAADARNVVASREAPARARFDFVHLLWYLGALLIIGAMGLFSTIAFSAIGGPALIGTAIGYAVVFLLAGDYLWRKKGLTTPGGLLISAAIAMVPLLVYGIQETFSLWGSDRPGTVQGFYVWVKSGWLPMELATITAASLALIRYRFPFIVAIIAFLLWFVSMDFAAWLVGNSGLDWEIRRRVSIWFGLGVMALAFFVDHAQKRADFAFWLHLFGALTFWGGIVMRGGGTPIEKVGFGLLCSFLLLYSVFMDRRIYSVFGAIGLMILLGDLSRNLFRNAVLFPFILTAVGLAFIGLGLWYLKHRDAIAAMVERLIPEQLRSLRPPHARALSGGI